MDLEATNTDIFDLANLRCMGRQPDVNNLKHSQPNECSSQVAVCQPPCKQHPATNNNSHTCLEAQLVARGVVLHTPTPTNLV